MLANPEFLLIFLGFSEDICLPVVRAVLDKLVEGLTIKIPESAIIASEYFLLSEASCVDSLSPQISPEFSLWNGVWFERSRWPLIAERPRRTP